MQDRWREMTEHATMDTATKWLAHSHPVGSIPSDWEASNRRGQDTPMTARLPPLSRSVPGEG
eukprot:4538903-Alexandrium_andersonii.AAC.1